MAAVLAKLRQAEQEAAALRATLGQQAGSGGGDTAGKSVDQLARLKPAPLATGTHNPHLLLGHCTRVTSVSRLAPVPQACALTARRPGWVASPRRAQPMTGAPVGITPGCRSVTWTSLWVAAGVWASRRPAPGWPLVTRAWLAGALH